MATLLPSSHFPAGTSSLHLAAASCPSSHLEETQEYNTGVRCVGRMIPVTCMHSASPTWLDICPGGQQAFPRTCEGLSPQLTNPFLRGHGHKLTLKSRRVGIISML